MIDGLWGLAFGGAAAGSPDKVFFTAGPNGDRTGSSAASPLRSESRGVDWTVRDAALARFHDDRRHVHLQPLSSSHRKYSVPTPTLHLPTATIETRVEEPKRLHQTAVTPSHLDPRAARTGFVSARVIWPSLHK